MTLLHLLAIEVIGGFFLWLFNGYVTFVDVRVKKIINVVALIVLVAIAVVWVLGFLGVNLNTSTVNPRSPMMQRSP